MDDRGESSTWLILNNNLYQSLKHLNSYKMVLSVSTTPPYKMSVHDVLRIYNVFLMFYNSILGLQKASKSHTRAPYIKACVTKCRAPNLQLWLFGHSVTQCLGEGASCSYKMPQYKPFVRGSGIYHFVWI